MVKRSLHLLLLGTSFFFAGSAPAQDALAILKESCTGCHNPSNLQGKLDLTRRDAMLKGGERGPAIVPGNAKASLLYQLASHQSQPGMPMGAPRLPQAALDTLARWIDAGASEAPASLFASVVKPLFETKCLGCHFAGAGKKSGFDLTTREKLLEGGEHGPGAVSGDPAESALVKRLKGQLKPAMPFQGDAVPADVVAKVEEWIKSGANYDAPLSAPVISKKDDSKGHWAFQKPVQAPTPKVADAKWASNPVDAFLAAAWDKQGLKPSPELDKRLLLRRLYLDLTGLPPAAEDTRAFLADSSPKAYEKVVDRLLESKRYGERWGRHWMDVWRYSDWYGRRVMDDQRYSARHIWRWRDWIIESLNQDKGYDRMLQEMLAGDEIAPNDPNTLRATGYLVRSYHRFSRTVWMQDTVEHVAAGFLGITMKCARCHDHKYDPFPQEEYYRLRAFFEPYDVRIDRVPGGSDIHENGLARVFDAKPRKGSVAPYFPPIYEKTFRLIRGDDTTPDSKELSPGTPAALGEFSAKFVPVKLGLEAKAPDLRGFVGGDLAEAARHDLRIAGQAVLLARKAVDEARTRVDQLGGKPWQPAAAAKPDTVFADQIQPLLAKRCRVCHGGYDAERTQRSGLSVASLDLVLRGGNLYGPAAIPGDSAKSPMVRYLRGELSPRMPLGLDAIPNDELQQIVKWIDAMQEVDPRISLRRAEARLAFTRRRIDTARLALASIQARVAAEAARYAQPADPRAADLAKSAGEAERQLAIAQAQEAILEATDFLLEASSAGEADRMTAGKKVSAAKAKLDAASAALAKGGDTYTPVAEVFPDTSSGRRTALAQWLTDRNNPLTARVAVNHIWLRHFGKPIVPTVANFGRNGVRPTNQALLDWLAVRLMDEGWSMKKMHRLLVTSNAYRMISAGSELSAANKKIDPDNKYLWRMNARRMEAEVVRDSALMLAGALDETMGGPDSDEEQAMRSRRRSVYIRHSPENRADFLRLFDQPDPTECYMRTESVIPQQALASANSTLAYEAARLIAGKLAAQAATEDAFIRSSFELILGTQPTTAELTESRKFLAEQRALLADASKLTRFSKQQEASVAPATDARGRARENLVHALLNHNEFVTVR